MQEGSSCFLFQHHFEPFCCYPKKYTSTIVCCTKLRIGYYNNVLKQHLAAVGNNLTQMDRKNEITLSTYKSKLTLSKFLSKVVAPSDDLFHIAGLVIYLILGVLKYTQVTLL